MRRWVQCLPYEDPLGRAQTLTPHLGGGDPPLQTGGTPYEGGIDFLLTYTHTLMRTRVDTPWVQYASPQAQKYRPRGVLPIQGNELCSRNCSTEPRSRPARPDHI